VSLSQPGILAPIPAAGRFLSLGLAPDADVGAALGRLAEARCGEDLVLGLGEPLVRAAGGLGAGPPSSSKGSVAKLRPFPALCGPAVAFPSTQGAIWAMIRGADAGALLHRARGLLALLGHAFRLDEDVATFKFAGGRDLSGYEDGTENPKDDRAAEVAVIAGEGEGLDGGSFVAAQRWVHDLGAFERLPEAARDAIIGRRLHGNEEIADAPASAHVKRAAQESFEPAAFMLRRSMPWGAVGEHGIYFVAFGATLDPFERVLRRMAGLDDGITDGLLRFSRAVSGGYYWCPPLHADGRLDLRAIQR
jgi:putative iron-dependent peroxidase